MNKKMLPTALKLFLQLKNLTGMSGFLFTEAEK